MDQQQATQEIARLDAIVRSEGGSTAFPALAEAHRMAGRPELAERVARDGLRQHPDHAAGRVALGLALLDQQRIDDARSELQRVLDAVPDHAVARQALSQPRLPEVEAAAESDFLSGVADAELDRAFESAQPQRSQMVDADGVAAAALRSVEREPETASVVEPLPEAVIEPEAGGLGAPFETGTMAELLESQGHDDEARRIRASLDSPTGETPAPAASPEPEDSTVNTLETWLTNLRKVR